MAGFLDEYNAKRAACSKRFECPVTGQAMRMEKPRFRERQTAEAQAFVRWREQAGEQVMLSQFADLARAYLIGACLYVEGEREPLGECALELDEQLLDHYDAILRSIENPPIEELRPELLDEMVADLKKKSARVVQHLNVSEGSTLYHLLLYMASQLSS